MNRRCKVASIRDRNANQDIVGSCFRVFREHIKISALIKNPGVREFKLGIVSPSPTILSDQLIVWELRLRILIQRLHVGMCWCGIEIKITLLHIFSVISFRSGQTEKSLFENLVLAIPEREREAQATFSIRDSQQPVFAPSIGTTSSMFMGKGVPAFTGRGVIFTHSSPLTFRQVRSPTLPVGAALV